jgi:hypothetical protein
MQWMLARFNPADPDGWRAGGQGEQPEMHNQNDVA